MYIFQIIFRGIEHDFLEMLLTLLEYAYYEIGFSSMKFISSVKYKRTLKYVEYRRCIHTSTQGFDKFCAMFQKDH